MWSEQQSRWREAVLAKAAERKEQREKARQEKEAKKQEKWQRVSDRIEEIRERLRHLEGIPVEYDGGNGKVAVISEIGDEEEEAGEEQEVAWVKVIVAGRGYVAWSLGITYGEAKLVRFNQYVSEMKARQEAERWVEEHAYGTGD